MRCTINGNLVEADLDVVAALLNYRPPTLLPAIELPAPIETLVSDEVEVAGETEENNISHAAKFFGQYGCVLDAKGIMYAQKRPHKAKGKAGFNLTKNKRSYTVVIGQDKLLKVAHHDTAKQYTDWVSKAFGRFDRLNFPNDSSQPPKRVVALLIGELIEHEYIKRGNFGSAVILPTVNTKGTDRQTDYRGVGRQQDGCSYVFILDRDGNKLVYHRVPSANGNSDYAVCVRDYFVTRLLAEKVDIEAEVQGDGREISAFDTYRADKRINKILEQLTKP